jgi:hypothetical protein
MAYLDRNSPWLIPLLLSLVLITTPALTEVLGIQIAQPKWLPIAGAILGFFLAGLSSMFVDTVSARIVRLVGTGLGIAMIAAAIFG